MFLIVGLGNPGAEYENTRHNVGFMTADALFKTYHFAPFKSKFDGEIAEGKINNEKVFLLKPHTFMNLSGNSVVKAANFYKILPENIVVIHDDLDLKIGKIKAKLGGGAGGHNGLKSIDAAISQNYNRIRIGIGNPNLNRQEVINHVLSRFSKEDGKLIAQAIDLVVENIDVMLEKGWSDFANRIGNLTKD